MAQRTRMLGLFLVTLSSFLEALQSTQIYDYTKYHPMDEISRWMGDMERGNPELVCSTVYGHTYEGRNITLLKIVHSYSTNKTLEQMLQNLDVYVTPVVDGYMFSGANTSVVWMNVMLFPKSAGSEPEAKAVMDFVDPYSGSSCDWARLIGIPFSYAFELRDKGEFRHLLPEEQIQPACEEAYVGALSIIAHVHDKTFNSGTLLNAAVSGVAKMIWSSITTVFV